MNTFSIEESEQAYRSLFEYSQDAVYFLDLDGLFIKINKSCETMSGFTETDLLNSTFIPLIEQKDLPNVISCFNKACGGVSQNYSTIIRHKNGNKVYINVTNVPVIVDYKIIGVFGVAKDITVEKQLEIRLKEIEQRYRLIEEHSSTIIRILDNNGIIVYASPSHFRILGYKPEEIEGHHISQLIHTDDRTYAQKILRAIVKNKEGSRFETRWHRKDDELVWLENHGEVILDGYGDVDQIVIVSTDITERKNNELIFRHMAHHDTLTDLPNRRAFVEKLEQIITSESNTSCAVLFLDCDKFKQVNDNYGHNIGDLVLKEFAKRLQDSLPKKAHGFRYAGDEFTVLVEDVKNPNEAIEVAEEILLVISGSWDIEDNQIPLSTSIGIAYFPQNGCTVDGLLRSADNAMYLGKNSGGNTYRVAGFQHR